ncbi:upstream stimulatory factor 2-like isoform X5 [Crassostrea virginica]|uniref:Upstream stimulatory factor 2-like isoform X5 n=1 Tax=Crassostrea virginica TaxID=6565 RepID=A0A8B8DBK0_CRAVI|nr:upstream stimulatory factor 2-like isoform X5 [Crassostrea virginica]
MDMLDQALEASHEDTKDSTGSDDVVLTGDGEEGIGTVQNVAQSQITLDPNLQYQLRTDNGQVTYRVVQVTGDGTESAQVVATNAFQPGAQAVIQSPFSNGGSPTPDNQATETRFTYFPTTVVTNADQVTSQGDVSGAWATGETAIQQAGQFYVMMSPQEVLQGQRNIAPRTGFTPKVEGVRTGRDDRRRATHNEVERRRRDKINNWIVQLSKVIPDCSQEHTKQGQVSSKGGILSKACDYITELKTANMRMSESLKETERLSVDLDLLRQQCEELKSENSILRAQLQSHGLIPDIAGTNS